MTFDETMRALEAAGTEQARKIYRRHGAPEPMFGVSFGVLEKLRKTIKADHALARQLWDSRNTDARNLATLIVDPAEVTAAELERWVADPDSGFFAGLLARHVVAKTRFAHDKALAWIVSPRAETAQVGWIVICAGAQTPGTFADAELLALLPAIEAKIHSAKNGVREAMNYAVIAIGVRNAVCQKAAIAAARRIGKVEVDHGETHCKTPDAEAYILKTMTRRASRPPPRTKPKSAAARR